MLRALSTRRSANKYEKLGDEPADVYLLQDMKVEPQLKRVTTLPPAFFSAKEIESFSRRQQQPLAVVPEFLPAEKLSKAKSSSSTKKAEKVHPLFAFMDPKRRRKATAKPEFARYVEYLKEGGFVRQQGSS